MFKRLLAVVRDALAVPFAPATQRPDDWLRHPDTPRQTHAATPTGTDGFDELVASISSDDRAEIGQLFARSAAAFAPGAGDVAAIRALLSVTALLGCDHDPVRGSLRLATAYGDVVVATSSQHAPTVASRFIPGECSVIIAGHGRNTNLIAAGAGWECWVEVASLNFDPGASC